MSERIHNYFGSESLEYFFLVILLNIVSIRLESRPSVISKFGSPTRAKILDSIKIKLG